MALFVANNGQLQTIKGIYYGMTEDYINATLFHNLVPKTATEIKFLYASNNPDLTDYQKLGYCDNNNFIEVWNSGTKYIIINPRKNYIYAPVICNRFLYNYVALTNCIFDNFDTRNVHDMQFMFQNCTSLTSLDLSNFNTKNVWYMSYMFAQCGNLTSLDLRNFNTRSVSLFLYMFFLCGKLTTMTASFDITNASNLEAFMYGTKVPNVYLAGNPTKCKTFNSAFEYSKIVTISSNSFTIRANATSNNMFKDCTSLVGGNGTTYSSSHTNSEYARVDGENGLPGYFTAPTN